MGRVLPEDRYNEELVANVHPPDWRNPEPAERYHLVVLGAGTAGLVTAAGAAGIGARVALVERHLLGGDCLNVGCVPSKCLIRSSRVVFDIKEADRYGVNAPAGYGADFPGVMERMRRLRAHISHHDSVRRFASLGVDVFMGEARFAGPDAVEVGGTRLRFSKAVIATGARAAVPPVEGLHEAGFLTNESVFSLTELPQHLVVLGAGPIGCELAQAFASIGCQVTQVARSGILPKEDSDAIALVEAALRADGVRLLTGTAALCCEVVAAEQRLVVRQGKGGAEEAIPFDVLLCAIGRKPRVTSFGLEELGIPLTRTGTIETNACLQTRYPNILACGDVAGPYQFTHYAAHQAWYAAVNGLFGGIKRFKLDNRVIPRVTFTDPEVAQVGLSETQAKAQGIAYEVTRYDLDDLDRAITESAAHGFVKVLTPPGKDTLLGACIVGEHAGELLAEFTLAMKHGLGLNKILGTIHPYPTWSEAAKYTAGTWKRAHAPQSALGWLVRLHSWRRG